jgi:hypothetical protein
MLGTFSIATIWLALTVGFIEYSAPTYDRVIGSPFQSVVRPTPCSVLVVK